MSNPVGFPVVEFLFRVERCHGIPLHLPSRPCSIRPLQLLQLLFTSRSNPIFSSPTAVQLQEYVILIPVSSRMGPWTGIVWLLAALVSMVLDVALFWKKVASLPRSQRRADISRNCCHGGCPSRLAISFYTV
jgi:hypothetical protein